MSKFHSTVSRRDFMKGLGLAGAGLSATAAASPVFHDLDEVIASPGGGWKNPWWVTERDFNNPTTEVDWNMMQRYDKHLFRTGDYQKLTDETKDRCEGWYGTTSVDELWSMGAKQNWQGVTLRDTIWRNAMNSTARADYNFVASENDRRGRKLKTHETYDVPKWSGTPEEALHMMRVISRMAGAYNIGVAEVDETNKKVMWSYNGKNDVFEDVDQAYETDEKRVIPNKCKYVFTYIIRHTESMKTAPGNIGGASQAMAYFNASHAAGRLQAFLRGIGYQALWSASAGNSSWPVLTGVGEQGRGNLMLTTQHGALVRKMDFIFTDLPLTPTKPIDAGIRKFCYTCNKCATHCPTQAVSTETEPTWDITGPWNNPGLKHWYTNMPICNFFKSNWGPGYCGICIASCPYSRHDKAWIHEAVAAALATTTLFNGFLRTMDDVMGYGNNWRAHGEGDTYVTDWWETLPPEYGLKTYEGSSPY